MGLLFQFILFGLVILFFFIVQRVYFGFVVIDEAGVSVFCLVDVLDGVSCGIYYIYVYVIVKIGIYNSFIQGQFTFYENRIGFKRIGKGVLRLEI